MNEQLEYLRLRIIEAEDSLKARILLFNTHYTKLRALADGVREVHPSEKRRTILLQRFNAAYPEVLTNGKRLMPIVDVLCEIYQKTNNNNVRRLIDVYEGGWNG